MHNMNRIILGLLLACSIISCGPSTKITKSWHEPGATYKKSEAKKILVIALVVDEVSRRVIEDELVKKIGTNATPSYTIFTDDMLRSLPEGAFTEKLKKEQFQYMLMMRLVDVEKETTYVPGNTMSYYGGYGSYYAYGVSMYSSPGYYATDKNYIVETTVYSIVPDKLLWAGTTESMNPNDIKKAVGGISTVVSDKMRQDGFLLK